MDMRFDRKADGEGVQMSCRFENGRLYTEWSFQVEACSTPSKMSIHLRLTDRGGSVALECIQQLTEEEPLQAILLQPRLWNSTQDAYLYRLEVFLLDGQGNCVDSVGRQIPLRVLENRRTPGVEGEELLLNGECFQPRAVRYTLPTGGIIALLLSDEAVEFTEADHCRMREDMQRLVRLGANCICLEGHEPDGYFLQLCDSLGLVVCGRGSEIKLDNVDKIPWFKGSREGISLGGEIAEQADEGGLFAEDTLCPTSRYYQYKAKWSPEPFVYIVPESIKRMKSGNYTVTCYSNCNRVALYSDGVIFEFQKGEEKFTFWEVPAKTPCIMLSAEGEGCSQSFSIHKNFTN